MAKEQQKKETKKTGQKRTSKGDQKHGDIPQETQKEKEKAAKKGK